MRTISALAVSAVLLLFAAAPAFAANEIAYQCDLDVCLLDPANPSAVTNLSDNGATSYDEKPIWSPDGNKVAFVSDFTSSGHGEKNVFVMEPGAADQAVNLATQITPYSSGRQGDRRTRLVAGRQPDRLHARQQRRRRHRLGRQCRRDHDLPARDRLGREQSGTRPGPRTARRSPMRWSKTSRNRSTSRPRPAASATPLPNGVGHEPNWSPDGSRIAFDAYNSGSFGYVDLHIVAADGSGTPLIVTPNGIHRVDLQRLVPRQRADRLPRDDRRRSVDLPGDERRRERRSSAGDARRRRRPQRLLVARRLAGRLRSRPAPDSQAREPLPRQQRRLRRGAAADQRRQKQIPRLARRSQHAAGPSPAPGRGEAESGLDHEADPVDPRPADLRRHLLTAVPRAARSRPTGR